MIPKGFESAAAQLKLKAIKEASRLALRHCLKVKDSESLDTLTLNAEIGKRWDMFNASAKKNEAGEWICDPKCTSETEIFVKPADIPDPIIPQAAKLDFPVNQAPIPKGRPQQRGKHVDVAGD